MTQPPSNARQIMSRRNYAHEGRTHRRCRFVIAATLLSLVIAPLICGAVEESRMESEKRCLGGDNNADVDTNCVDDAQQEQCGLYMAESSIPNAGWGMYTGIAMMHGDPLFHPEIVVQAMDPRWHVRRYEQVTHGDDETHEPFDDNDWLMRA
mmetsp:Transcript_6624/g.11907  ORF Transcript_6624/g.11907 Transcript_6624/m.11907 type:complete len:152 (+) Transcript_6624:104-559(+)